MATTGIIDGSIIVLKSGGTTIAHSTSFEFSESVSTRNITTKDTANGSTEYAAQRIDRTVSGEFLLAWDAAEGYSEARSDLEALTSVALTWGTFVTGDQEFAANAIITSASLSAPLDDNATWNIEMSITGDVTESTTA